MELIVFCRRYRLSRLETWHESCPQFRFTNDLKGHACVLTGFVRSFNWGLFQELKFSEVHIKCLHIRANSDAINKILPDGYCAQSIIECCPKLYKATAAFNIKEPLLSTSKPLRTFPHQYCFAFTMTNWW